MEITSMKNADSLSMKKPKATSSRPVSSKEMLFPKITVNEKISPITDAMIELEKDTYVQSLSFLCRITDKTAPIKYVRIIPGNRYV
jgi:hypothetical protein